MGSISNSFTYPLILALWGRCRLGFANSKNGPATAEKLWCAGVLRVRRFWERLSDSALRNSPGRCVSADRNQRPASKRDTNLDRLSVQTVLNPANVEFRRYSDETWYQI